MDRQLKQRVVGAAVLVVLGVIFIPVFLDQGSLETHVPDAVDIPPPEGDFVSRVGPLEEADIEALERRAVQPIELPDEPPEPPSETSTAPVAPVETPEPTAVAEAPQPPAEPAPDAPASDGGPDPEEAAWAVQLGSFAEPDNASRLIEKLRAAGLPAYVEQGRSDGETVHKVRVGPEIDRAQAEQLRERLSAEFELEGLLLRYP